MRMFDRCLPIANSEFRIADSGFTIAVSQLPIHEKSRLKSRRLFYNMVCLSSLPQGAGGTNYSPATRTISLPGPGRGGSCLLFFHWDR